MAYVNLMSLISTVLVNLCCDFHIYIFFGIPYLNIHAVFGILDLGRLLAEMLPFLDGM